MLLFVWQDTEVAKFLIDIDLEHLVTKFEEEGIKDIEDINDMSKDDMKEMGLNIGDRNKINRKKKEWSK